MPTPPSRAETLLLAHTRLFEKVLSNAEVTATLSIEERDTLNVLGDVVELATAGNYEGAYEALAPLRAAMWAARTRHFDVWEPFLQAERDLLRTEREGRELLN